MKTPHSRFTRSQILDALRRHAGESQADCAKRIGKTVRSVTNYLSLGIPDKQFVGILRAYGVDAAGAETIAAGLPVLKAGVAQTEIARREAAASQNMEGRDPADRKPGEPRWWVDSRFQNRGPVEEPAFAEGQKVYTPGLSLLLAVVDARTKRGMDTSKSAVVESCLQAMLLRNPNHDPLAETQFSAWFDKLVEEEAIEVRLDGARVSEEVRENAILHMAIGNPTQPFPLSCGRHSSTLCEFVSFDNRYEVLEDLLDEAEESGADLI